MLPLRQNKMLFVMTQKDIVRRESLVIATELMPFTSNCVTLTKVVIYRCQNGNAAMLAATCRWSYYQMTRHFSYAEMSAEDSRFLIGAIDQGTSSSR